MDIHQTDLDKIYSNMQESLTMDTTELQSQKRAPKDLSAIF